MIFRENTPEEDAAYEEWVEDGGRLWVVYLAYYSGRPKALFAMSRRDAMAFCSDKRTKGRHWMACHTRLEDWQEKGEVPAKLKMKDNGSLDPVIDELGLTKIPI